MKVKDVIEKLKEFDDDLVICVFDSVYEDYTSRLLFEIVEDESFITEDEEKSNGNILLL